MKKISLILAILLALCACACAESVQEEKYIQVTEAELQGLWNLEYVTTDGYMVQAKTYGMIVTLSLFEDLTAEMDFDGEVLGDMSWRTEDGHGYITGYTSDGEVELLLTKDGVLEITDEIGSMFFTRPVEEEKK